MEISNLKVTRNLQGVYAVTEFGILVWQGLAASPLQAKRLAKRYDDNARNGLG